MSLSGLRKQFNKANQYLSETMGAAEATKLDDTFNEMERKIDATYSLITDIVAGTNEYLQPNPATRAKMATMGAVSKLRGTTKTSPYPQTEGMLAETMVKYGKALGDESHLGRALVDSSEAYRQMADIKYQMEEVVKHNFLDPLTQLQNNELKDVNHHRTKLKGRRLDYDCKKRKGTRDDELIQAEEKLEESKKLAEMAMHNVLINDVEQISQLSALVEAQLDFHRQTAQILETLHGALRQRVNEASMQLRSEHVPRPVLNDRTPRSRSPIDSMSSGFSAQQAPPPYTPSPSHSVNGGGAGPLPPKAAPSPSSKPSARALFDFTAENEGELELKEGQIVELVAQIDENWFEGKVNGKSGLFPISYVQVVVPIK
ncbi:unnamed protein product, partial [Mesorhabditis belari]|uniref:Uncharacterized protein n=1 Tax=Mesorhabditis belari TaxID=2138241 RepID=A0AAF3EDL6_9BILA